MLLELAQRAPVQHISLPEWSAKGVDVALWRLDMLDVAAPGNKFFKLTENLRAAHEAGHSRVLSFGGAYSNHIHALALSAAAAGMGSIGVIRGESTAAANPTLRDAAAAGMQLHFVDRATYRLLTRFALQTEPECRALLAQLQQTYGNSYVIPEGGANRLGVLGCRPLGEAISGLTYQPDCVALPCATGSTLAGVVAGLDRRSHVLGIAVLKGAEFIADQVRVQLRDVGAWHCNNWRIDTGSHEGGYARASTALYHFVARFTQVTGVAIEPIYSGKMLYAIHRCIERDEFARGTRVLAVHTGGLQGTRGLVARDQRGIEAAEAAPLRGGLSRLR
jgi:1-aminocyclopropane-1-carboxylate deaminase